MSNSLNKKILVITVVIFLCGFIVKSFQNNNTFSQKQEQVLAYELEPVSNIQFFSVDEMQKPREVDNLEFVRLSEVEDILIQHYFQENYIKSDVNFNTKVENITNYLGRRGAPLANEADYIVIMANKFGIDYRLLPAISIIESSGGLKIYKPYNAWGWGGAKGITFESWDHSIYIVSKGLARYYARGATTPEQMAPAYNPHTPNEWAAKVRMVMNQIGDSL
jgi:hypothetical protein